MRKKFGLALGAGGSRGIAHIGFLQALEEIGVKPDYVTGCSMGSIVGACYCSGVSPAKMKEFVLELSILDLTSFNIVPLLQNGFMQTKKARKLIVELMGERNFNQLKIPFECVATDLITGQTVELREGSVVDAALASSSIPGVFTPTKIGEYEMLVDGCLVERVPTRQLKAMGAEVIVAVDVLGNLMSEKPASGHLINTLLRCIDIMDTRNTQRQRKLRDYVDLWLEPKLGDMDQYKIKNLDFAYERGYQLGVENRNRVKDLIES